jgi:hypothetical protein
MKTTPLARLAACLLGALLVSHCGGGSPSSPSLNLAGTWTGTWRYVAGGATVSEAVTATLTQSGDEASGTWMAESGASGQFQRLRAASSTSGSLTISVTALGLPPCTATASVSGTASATSLELGVSPIASSGTCQWAANQQFALTRQ